MSQVPTATRKKLTDEGQAEVTGTAGAQADALEAEKPAPVREQVSGKKENFRTSSGVTSRKTVTGAQAEAAQKTEEMSSTKGADFGGVATKAAEERKAGSKVAGTAGMSDAEIVSKAASGDLAAAAEKRKRGLK